MKAVDIFLPVRFYWVRRARWLKLREKGKALEEVPAPSHHAEEAALVTN